MKYLIVALILVLLAVSNPVFAETGIGFWSNRDGGRDSFFVMNPDGSNPVNLSKELGLGRDPQWSPDGTKILYVLGRNGKDEIFMMNADGSNRVNVSNRPGADQHPRWAPDGTQIVWHGWPPRGVDRPVEIFVMNVNDSNWRNLGRGSGPTWSPDGTMLGFTVGNPITALIMNADGSGRRKLIDIGGDTEFLSWSPDGTKVAFSLHNHVARHVVVNGRFVRDDKQDHVYVANLDGSDPVDLTREIIGDPCIGAAWSPDGTKIAFHTLWGLPWSDIYAVNVDGTNLVRLTKQDPDPHQLDPHRADGYPRWSQDGTTVLFETKRDDNREIYIMNSDGSNPVNLTNHPQMIGRHLGLGLILQQFHHRRN